MRFVTKNFLLLTRFFINFKNIFKVFQSKYFSLKIVIEDLRLLPDFSIVILILNAFFQKTP